MSPEWPGDHRERDGFIEVQWTRLWIHQGNKENPKKRRLIIGKEHSMSIIIYWNPINKHARYQHLTRNLILSDPLKIHVGLCFFNNFPKFHSILIWKNRLACQYAVVFLTVSFVPRNSCNVMDVLHAKIKSQPQIR